MNSIVIIDYGMGNLRSVQKAFEQVGCDAVVTADPELAARADKLVLPGVGAFRDCMRNLEEGGFVDPIRAHIAAGRPFLGICVGMQLLLGSGSLGLVRAPGSAWPGLGNVLPRSSSYQITSASPFVRTATLLPSSLPLPARSHQRWPWSARAPLAAASSNVSPNGSVRAGLMNTPRLFIATRYNAGTSSGCWCLG